MLSPLLRINQVCESLQLLVGECERAIEEVMSGPNPNHISAHDRDVAIGHISLAQAALRRAVSHVRGEGRPSRLERVKTIAKHALMVIGMVGTFWILLGLAESEPIGNNEGTTQVGSLVAPSN